MRITACVMSPLTISSPHTHSGCTPKMTQFASGLGTLPLMSSKLTTVTACVV
jgi:hypothetical protein